MTRCVLVHHQLSCLLIHNAALRAGLYSGEESGARNAGANTAHVAGASPEELEESIHNIGGSTARLFSMALRDRHDLESMEGTLKQKVEQLTRIMQGEFKSANCNAENNPLASTYMFAIANP